VPNEGVAHAYAVPAGIVPVGAYENVALLHAVVLCEAMIAAGLTVTVTVKVAPVHVPEVGVTL
jgi:hypothetical protein